MEISTRLIKKLRIVSYHKSAMRYLPWDFTGIRLFEGIMEKLVNITLILLYAISFSFKAMRIAHYALIKSDMIMITLSQQKSNAVSLNKSNF